MLLDDSSATRVPSLLMLMAVIVPYDSPVSALTKDPAEPTCRGCTRDTSSTLIRPLLVDTAMCLMTQS